MERRNFTLAVAAATLAACSPQKSETKKEEPVAAAGITKKPFGKLPDGTAIDIYTLRNAAGMEASIITYGAIVQSLKAPDASGHLDDVVLGFDTIDGYLGKSPYFGAVVGRYGNRIGKGTFKLNGKTYHVPLNDHGNSLHGGLKGFDKKVWVAAMLPDRGLELTMTSPDGDEGYPGTLKVKVTYHVTDANELRIDYDSTAVDQDTVANITNHSYFNLAGQGNGTILDHEVKILAHQITPVDQGLIPTGKLLDVKGTPFDFTKPTAIGARIDDAKDQQLAYGGGYDHNHVLDGDFGTLRPVAQITEPKSKRIMIVRTTEPGVQFYTGNFLDGTLTGKGGKVYPKRGAFCMETQHFPDSPNHANFPSVVIKKGDTYHSTTEFAFKLPPI